MLAHFVGDLHQPLHVGAIYLDRTGQPVNPDFSGLDPLTETAGGNLIRDRYKDHDKDRDEPFHSEWDDIPDDVGEGANADMIRRARLVPPSTEPVEDFAATWASDSMQAAHKAFAGLTFTGTDHNQWLVHFRDRTTYWKSQDELKRDQLAKGGARLAQLLGLLQAPAARLLRTLNEPAACLARLVDALGKRRGSEDASAASEAERKG